MASKKVSGKSALTIIAPCDCQNAGQDLLYGKGQRAMNELGGKLTGFRCSVCGKIHQVSIKR